MPRKLVFQIFRASGPPESLFFKFFELRDSPKAYFSNFSSFGMPRKLVFQIFRASGAPDSSFSQKTTRRGIPKPYFSEFQPFGMPRSALFLIFWLSLLREALLSRSFCFQASLFSCPQSQTSRISFVGGELYPDVVLKAEVITVVGIIGVCRACPIDSHVTIECSRYILSS